MSGTARDQSKPTDPGGAGPESAEAVARLRARVRSLQGLTILALAMGLGVGFYVGFVVGVDTARDVAATIEADTIDAEP